MTNQYESTPDVEKIKLLQLMCGLGLITPGTYTKVVLNHFNSMSVMIAEMDKMNHKLQKSLERTMFGAGPVDKEKVSVGLFGGV